MVVVVVGGKVEMRDGRLKRSLALNSNSLT